MCMFYMCIYVRIERVMHRIYVHMYMCRDLLNHHISSAIYVRLEGSGGEAAMHIYIYIYRGQVTYVPCASHLGHFLTFLFGWTC